MSSAYQRVLSATGTGYFFAGIGWLWRPQLRIFLWVPLLINLLIFALLTTVLSHYFGEGLDTLLNAIPDWLHFLAWLIWLLFVVLLLLVYGYCFNLVTSVIAAPFYGILAQKVQELLLEKPLADEPMGQLIGRTFAREWEKLCYFIPRSLGVMLVVFLRLFVPLLNLLVPALVFAWGAWCMSIQFCDYAADNNRQGFAQLRGQLKARSATGLGFGCMCLLASMIPLINILAMPAAVTGGTLLWLERLRLDETG